MIRVTLIGAESGGKTSLASALARDLATSWSPESARVYAEERRAPLTEHDVAPIARGVMRLQDRAIALAERVVIHDTDLISTVVYSHHYYGFCELWIEEEARRRLADLYLLAYPDLEWTPDGIRDRADERLLLHRDFVRVLAAYGAPTILLQGTWEARHESALGVIRSRLERAQSDPLP